MKQVKVIHESIENAYETLNTEQREAISTTDGPLLIIAGPGSGKTFVLVLRALNILLQGKCEPKELLLCTFTEKAAYELKDRIWQAARKINCPLDLSQLQVGTIHAISNKYIRRYKLFSDWGNNPEVLDGLTQKLFLFENFNEIIEPHQIVEKYLGRWSTKWTAIEGITSYLNKITEELINVDEMVESENEFHVQLGKAYQEYLLKLKELNKLDFAHQQKIFYDLLQNPEIANEIKDEFQYVMVDEYQDTNYIQEQLILRLASTEENICVVGDDDQSLYRFRGATVRNILEFSGHFESCEQVKLETNYRSHEKIIASYNNFMASFDWEDKQTHRSFRYEKKVREDPGTDHEDYPSVFRIYAECEKDEGERLASLVSFLKESNVISDYNQVAVLLHSVKERYSGHLINALHEKSIPVFAPRARKYFDNPEVKMMVACYAVIFGWLNDNRGSLFGHALLKLADYVDECIKQLASAGATHSHPLAVFIRNKMVEIDALDSGQTLDERPADYLYKLVSFSPFKELMLDENAARNVATFSGLLAIFQNYYNYYVLTNRNKNYIHFHFFNSFLRFLLDGGINEYEDPDLPFPSGYVQMMTIHQAKGLEFPVVVVGSLAANISSRKKIDRDLQPFYHRPPFEPANRITGFDRMRLHYVAFSRPQKLLILTSTKQPKAHFNSIWEDLPQWPYVQKDILAAQRFIPRVFIAPKKAFSFTSHIKVYETCPRQYLFFKDYGFTPSRTAEMLFGSLVHQTIEDFHRLILSGQSIDYVQENKRNLFDKNYQYLRLSGLRPLSPDRLELAFTQTSNYLTQNLDRIDQVLETEVDVSVEKEDYILAGKVDLILGDDNKLELLDFKAQKRPAENSPWLRSYHDQLLMYAHILEERYQKIPDRLVLYWTAEKTREQASMTFPYQHEKVVSASERFDKIAHQILRRDFKIREYPEMKVCRECDLMAFCQPPGLKAKNQ